MTQKAEIEIVTLPGPGKIKVTEIQTRAICLTLSFSEFGDTRSTGTDIVEVDADHSELRVLKAIVNSRELNAIGAFDRRTRLLVNEYVTLSPFRNGMYLLALESVEAVENILQKRSVERAALVGDFIENYPELKERAKKSLRVIYSESDYPSQESLSNYFRMSWSYLDLGIPAKLAAVSNSVFEKERDRVKLLWENAAEEIRSALYAGVNQTLAHFLEQLKVETAGGKPRRLRDGMLVKIDRFFESVKRRDLTDSKTLDALIVRARKILSGLDEESLQDVTLRTTVGEKFTALQTALQPFMVARGRRDISKR
jgi:hypothetical protein